jgi:hypothetical protein
MKHFNAVFLRHAVAPCVAAFALLTGAASAQIPSADKSTTGMNSAMIKFFGENTNFICKADARLLDKKNQETTDMPMGFQMLGDKMRMDINMAKVKSKDMSPQFAAMMHSMGMDEMITILLPQKQTVLSIYPGLKSYAESPMTKDEIDATAYTYTVDKKRLGKETIDGHPCEKNDIILTDSRGAKQHAILWNASDMNNFPVQMQIPAPDSTLVMRFTDVKLGRPDESHFQAPEGMTKFESIVSLISDAAAKRTGEQVPKQ